MNLIEELSKYGITDRGNTALFNPINCSTAFFAEINTGKWLVVDMCPDNHPAWNIDIQDKSLAEMRSHIEEDFGDYYFQRNNIGVNAESNQPVTRAYVMERIRDQLYVYRDNIDFEIKDTVTTIHDFLESKDWSLDITDIETLRTESDEE